ncbi:hypothetical protein D3C73_930810 [compost metagenome]
MRATGMGAARLMRSQQDFSPQQSGRTHVLYQVIVPADQYSHPNPPWGVKHGEAVAAGYRRVLKGVQFSVYVKLAVGQANRVGIVIFAVFTLFDEPNTDRHVVALRQRTNTRQRRAGGNRFRQRANFAGAEVSHVPIAGNAHLREGQHLDLFGGGASDKALDHRQVVIFIVGAMLELHRRGAQRVCHKVTFGRCLALITAKLLITV